MGIGAGSGSLLPGVIPVRIAMGSVSLSRRVGFGLEHGTPACAVVAKKKLRRGSRGFRQSEARPRAGLHERQAAGRGGWLGIRIELGFGLELGFGALRGLGDFGSVGSGGRFLLWFLFKQAAEMRSPELVGTLLPFALYGGLLAGGVEKAGVEGLVRRGLDACGQGGCGAGGVLRFVAADAVAEGVVGNRPGPAERIALGRR